MSAESIGMMEGELSPVMSALRGAGMGAFGGVDSSSVAKVTNQIGARKGGKLTQAQMANVTDTRAMANPGRELDRKLMAERIAGALDKLTPRERTVFELKHYQGLKLRTIGEMLSTTEETAKNTLFRATRKLRLNLAELKGL